MRYTFFILLIALLCSCESETKTSTSFTDQVDSTDCIEAFDSAYVNPIACGDLNNDLVIDTAFVYTPRTRSCVNKDGEHRFYLDCGKEDCYNLIRFSCALPEIRFEESVWGYVENAGDLDQDGYSELLFSPGWFQGCEGHLYLYHYDGKEWKNMAEVTHNRCDDATLKKHIVLLHGKYYLFGTRYEEGDEKVYKVKIDLVPGTVIKTKKRPWKKVK